MGILVSVKEPLSDQIIMYPYLKELADGVIILFTARNSGTVVREGPNSPLGLHSDVFAEDDSVLFEGSITLTNAMMRGT